MPKLTINGRVIEAKAILFDKDGTLVDFHALWVNVVSAWIACLPADLRLNDAERREIAQSLGVTDKVDPLGPLLSRRVDQLALIAGFLYRRRQVPFSDALRLAQAAFDRAWQLEPSGGFRYLPAGSLALLPKVGDALAALRDLGWRTGMVTNDDRKLTSAVIDTLELAALLDAVACGDEVTNGKPHPDLVQRLCAELGVSVSETVIVGDGHIDLQMGKAAGCRATIGVTSGCASRELLLSEGPEVILASVADLLTMVPTVRTADADEELVEVAALYKVVGYNWERLPGERVFVARFDSQLLGAVRLCEEEGHMVLRGMHVLPTHQRQGIGRAMLAELLRSLDGRPCYCLPHEHLKTTFYGRYGGFEEVAPDALPRFLRARLTEHRRDPKNHDLIAMLRPGA